MEHLSDHIKETIDRVDGFTTGTLVVEEGKASLLKSDNTEIQLDDNYTIEARNGNEYVPLTVNEILSTLSVEGWPLYAGLYVRVRSR